MTRVEQLQAHRHAIYTRILELKEELRAVDYQIADALASVEVDGVVLSPNGVSTAESFGSLGG